MEKIKKYVYPVAFSATYFIIFAVLIHMLENVIPFPHGSYAPIAWMFLALMALLLVAIPVYCVIYSKVIVKEKSRFWFALFNGFVLALAYIIPYCLEDETYIYGGILFGWVELWTIVPLVIRIVTKKVASYTEGKSELIPAYVSLGNKSTPVWLQQKWSEGEYSEFIVKNGCGHCCAAMALNLHGIKIDPHEEFTLCRKLWGEPKEHQGNYQTVSGITEILAHYGVSACRCGVPSRKRAARRIQKALESGKQVIFWSKPREDFPENPFSKGSHYVLAVGYTKDGQILVANSSQKSAPSGVQTVDIDTIAQALYLGAAPRYMTWGERDRHINCAGYVIVG